MRVDRSSPTQVEPTPRRGGPLKQYRALISVPVEAASDADAVAAANEQAAALRYDDGGVAGHVELVGEVREDLLEIVRVVRADAMFLRQVPPEWKA